jgi:hypothetical protein
VENSVQEVTGSIRTAEPWRDSAASKARDARLADRPLLGTEKTRPVASMAGVAGQETANWRLADANRVCARAPAWRSLGNLAVTSVRATHAGARRMSPIGLGQAGSRMYPALPFWIDLLDVVGLVGYQWSNSQRLKGVLLLHNLKCRLISAY